MDAAAGSIVNVLIDSTQFDLIEEDSVDYDAGESTSDYELAAKEISETFHEVANPTLEFTTAVDSAAQAGLEAAGIVDADGNYQVSGSREVENVTAEWLDADNGQVEVALEIPRGTVEFSGLSDQNPILYDIEIHINEKPVISGESTTTE